jgi:tetratricopeptide (TPR) repeat protein
VTAFIPLCIAGLLILGTPQKPATQKVIALALSKEDAPWRVSQTESLLAAFLAQAGVLSWTNSSEDETLSASDLRKLRLAGILRSAVSKNKKQSYTWSTSAGEVRQIEISSKNPSLHGQASELAQALLAQLGIGVDAEGIKNWIPAQPDFLHEIIAAGHAYLRRDMYRKAEFKFESALAKRMLAVLPSALDGVVIARTRAARHQSELARAAIQKARVAEQQGRIKLAYDSWRSFLLFSPFRARAFSHDLALGLGPLDYFHDDQKLWINTPNAFVTIDKETGVIRSNPKRTAGLLAVFAGNRITRAGAKITRTREADGKIIWSKSLPRRFKKSKLSAFVTSGALAITAEQELIWLDLTVGKTLQSARGVALIAPGSDGLLFSRANETGFRLEFYKPGRGKPAWTNVLRRRPNHIALVRGRAVLRFDEQVQILDTRNGKQRGGAIKLSSKQARFIGANGRYAVYQANDQISIIDVLGGVLTAEAKGPGRALIAHSTPSGVIIAYESSDVISYSRDGEVLDRTRVLGSPLAILDGHPKTPSRILLTTLGVMAIGAVASRDEGRDLDAYLGMSRALAKLGEPKLALQILTHIASQNLGLISVFEIERCRLLTQAKDIQQAHERAITASDASIPLPWFYRAAE